MHASSKANMQVLLLLLPLVLPVVILLIIRHATPPIKALLKSRPRKPIITRDFSTAHHLLVRGSRISMTPSAVISGGRYHNITSAPSGGQLWRALRHNLSSGVLHPAAHLGRYAAARRQAVRGLVTDLREQQLANGVALAAESIREAMFGLASTMCFGEGVDAGVVRAMADVQTKVILSLPSLQTFTPGPLTFLGAVSRLMYRKRWNKLAAIRQEQEDLYLPLIDCCRKHRRDPDETPSYVHTLLDLLIPVEIGADDHN
ncbi:unnamed protein product [Urochloa humidicola]